MYLPFTNKNIIYKNKNNIENALNKIIIIFFEDILVIKIEKEP